MPLAGEHTQNVSAQGPPIPLRIYFPVASGDRLFQGEVVERVIEWAAGYNEKDQDKVDGAKPYSHALVLIMTQDCDLATDWISRQNQPRVETDLKSILLCPGFPAEDLRVAAKLTSRRWETVRQNKDERYAYLSDIPRELDAAGDGHGAILLDLTNYLTIRTVELYRQLRVGPSSPRRRCRLETPWREHLQLRFALYQARIGLPQDHFVPESRRPELPSQ